MDQGRGRVGRRDLPKSLQAFVLLKNRWVPEPFPNFFDATPAFCPFSSSHTGVTRLLYLAGRPSLLPPCLPPAPEPEARVCVWVWRPHQLWRSWDMLCSEGGSQSQAERLPALNLLERARTLPVPSKFLTWAASTEHPPLR